MSSINSVSNQLLQSQLVNVQLQNNRSVSVKSPGTGEKETRAEETLEGKSSATSGNPSSAAQASGLGENFEVTG